MGVRCRWGPHPGGPPRASPSWQRCTGRHRPAAEGSARRVARMPRLQARPQLAWQAARPASCRHAALRRDSALWAVPSLAAVATRAMHATRAIRGMPPRCTTCQPEARGALPPAAPPGRRARSAARRALREGGTGPVQGAGWSGSEHGLHSPAMSAWTTCRRLHAGGARGRSVAGGVRGGLPGGPPGPCSHPSSGWCCR